MNSADSSTNSGCFYRGNEPSGSVRCGEFLDQLGEIGSSTIPRTVLCRVGCLVSHLVSTTQGLTLSSVLLDEMDYGAKAVYIHGSLASGQPFEHTKHI